MRRKPSFVLMIFILLTGFMSGSAQGAESDEAISKVKLTQESLSSNMKIAEEISATEDQILKIRMKMGFPLTALLNQVIIYDAHQAQVNYMAVPDEKWTYFGHSKLVSSEGRKSLIFEKNGVLIQMAATTEELEDRLVRLLRIDRLQTVKIKLHRLPEDWALMNDRFLKEEDLRGLEQRSGARIRRGIVQDMIINRRKVEIGYYDCGTEQSAELVGQNLANSAKSMVKRLVTGSGPIGVLVESSSAELNEYVMAFVNW